MNFYATPSKRSVWAGHVSATETRKRPVLVVSYIKNKQREVTVTLLCEPWLAVTDVLCVSSVRRNVGQSFTGISMFLSCWVGIKLWNIERMMISVATGQILLNIFSFLHLPTTVRRPSEMFKAKSLLSPTSYSLCSSCIIFLAAQGQ